MKETEKKNGMTAEALAALCACPVVTDSVLETAPDYTGVPQDAVIFYLSAPAVFPFPFSALRSGIFLHANGTKALLKIPLRSGTLPYYYPDYQNYWYFPAEDTAIHRSLAQYADKNHRIKATKDTAYTRIPADAVRTWSSRELTDYCRNLLQYLLN